MHDTAHIIQLIFSTLVSFFKSDIRVWKRNAEIKIEGKRDLKTKCKKEKEHSSKWRTKEKAQNIGSLKACRGNNEWEAQ